MLARIYRFHGHGSVRRAYRTGRPVRGALMSLHIGEDERAKRPRVAVVVSKKIHKSAVIRNRIRRRIYEQLRLRMDTWKRPYQIVVTVYQEEIAHIPVQELSSAIDSLLKRARIS